MHNIKVSHVTQRDTPDFDPISVHLSLLPPDWSVRLTRLLSYQTLSVSFTLQAVTTPQFGIMAMKAVCVLKGTGEVTGTVYFEQQVKISCGFFCAVCSDVVAGEQRACHICNLLYY